MPSLHPHHSHDPAHRHPRQCTLRYFGRLAMPCCCYGDVTCYFGTCGPGKPFQELQAGNEGPTGSVRQLHRHPGTWHFRWWQQNTLSRGEPLQLSQATLCLGRNCSRRAHRS